MKRNDLKGVFTTSEKKSLDPDLSFVNSKPHDGFPLFYASYTLNPFGYLCY